MLDSSIIGKECKCNGSEGDNKPGDGTYSGELPQRSYCQLYFKPVNIIPIKFPVNTKAYEYVDSALTKIYGKRPLRIGAGGSVGPLVDIKEELGIYAYSFGFQQPDEKWHSANEFFRLSSIKKGMLLYCYYLQLIADTGKN